MNDDDDIQEYISYREAFPKKNYNLPVDRNDVIEEVAKEIEKMKAFGQDTIDSFTVYIRSMKKWMGSQNNSYQSEVSNRYINIRSATTAMKWNHQRVASNLTTQNGIALPAGHAVHLKDHQQR